jgi:hypothetical protein
MSGIIDTLEGALKGFSLDPFDLLKGLKKLPPDRWDPVSVDGKPVGTVTAHDLGAVLPTSAWASWTWTPTGGSGSDSLRVDAAAGSKNVKVTLNGTVADENGRLQVRPLVVGLSLKISVRVHFVNSGTATEYRFDGRSAP